MKTKGSFENRLETLDSGPGWLRSRFVTREQIQDRNRWLLDNPHLPGYLWRVPRATQITRATQICLEIPAAFAI